MDNSYFRELSYFPPGDEKQKVRIQRFFMSLGFYILCAIPLGISVYFDLLPSRVMLNWVACSIVGNLTFYSAMRLNFNKRFKDPSLTIHQLILASSLVLYLQIYAGPLRGGYLMALMLAFAFGCFKLTRRELLGLTLLTVLAYLATIPLIKKVDGVHFNLAVELTLWITFSVFMPSLALVASTFSGLRQKLSETNQKLTYLNRYDSLTGVNNRAYFNEKYDLEWRRSQRSRGMIALLVIDIDHFKCVNDTFGHLAGDACLKHVAKIIVEAARRPTDDAFRYGGEEFMVLLANTDAQGAAHIGEIIRSKIEASEIVFDGKQISLTISAGVSAAIPEPGSTCDVLIACADRAMYQAKENGRNRVSVYGQEVHRIP